MLSFITPSVVMVSFHNNRILTKIFAIIKSLLHSIIPNVFVQFEMMLLKDNGRITSNAILMTIYLRSYQYL